MTIEEMKALEAAATKGPWTTHHRVNVVGPRSIDKFSVENVSVFSLGGGVGCEVHDENAANATLAAQARNLFPLFVELLDAVEYHSGTVSKHADVFMVEGDPDPEQVAISEERVNVACQFLDDARKAIKEYQQ